MSSIAARLQTLRHLARLDQEEVARRAGISVRTYRRLEVGGSGNLASLASVANVFGLVLHPQAEPDDRRHIASFESIRLVNPPKVVSLSALVAPPSTVQIKLKVIPTDLARANAVVAAIHRHHHPVPGHRFSLMVIDEQERIHGVAIVGRPVARNTCQHSIAEVARLATNGTANACSALYAAAARTAREMGFKSVQTFILASEPGTSLRAAGWHFDGTSDNRGARHGSRAGRRSDVILEEPKQRWRRALA